MDMESRIDELKRERFLGYIGERQNSPMQPVQVGLVGDAMGLPYGEAIRIAEDLRRAGHLRSVGTLNPPVGPAVELTEAGRSAAARIASDASGRPNRVTSRNRNA
jgi:hypothetical protein